MYIISEGAKEAKEADSNFFRPLRPLRTPRNDTPPERSEAKTELEENSLEALERRSLIIDEAVNVLREIGLETFQNTLRDKLEFKGYVWEEAGPTLKAVNQFRFMGMRVALMEHFL